MSEKYTPTTETPQNEGEKSDYDRATEDAVAFSTPFDVDAARRIVAQDMPEAAPATQVSGPRRQESRTYSQGYTDGEREGYATGRRRGVRVGAIGTVLTGAAVVGGGALVNHAVNDIPEFSEQTTTYTVEPGDGVFDAAEQIEGIETVDIRDAVDHIQSDPANIDVLQDGLQPNEQLVIPVSVEGHESDK